MSAERDVVSHYARGDLITRLDAALAEDGVDPAHPTMESLAPYDHFHGRGFEATVQIADGLTIRGTDRILDVGSGIGGPARYFAQRFGCDVTGIDLTAEYCDVARELTRRLGRNDKVRFEVGDALAMPFASASFDGAYSMNVAMNVAEKSALYREIRRVLKADAWLMLSELARGAGGDVNYPTPWASSAQTSFLATPDATREALVATGFEVVSLRDTLDEAFEYGARVRAMVERGEKPPHRAVALMHGTLALEAIANVARGLKNGALVPIEILALKTSA